MAPKKRPSLPAQPNVESIVKAAVAGTLQANTQSVQDSTGRNPLLTGALTSSAYGYYLTGHYHASDHKRQLWNQAGYPDEIRPANLFNMYRRSGLAKATVDLKADKTWQTPPVIYEGDTDPARRQDEPTEFEKVFDEFAKDQALWARLCQVDKFQRVMRYAGFVIVCKEKDKRKPEEPLERVAAGPSSILKLQPVYETQIVINEAYTDITDPNYGLPKNYQFRTRTPGTRNAWENDEYELHPSRVITFAEGANDGSPFGVSALEAPFNALMDAEKTRMASAEGFYKNAKQRIVINYKDEENQGLSPEQLQELTEQVDEEARNLNSVFSVSGAEINSIQSSMIDPNPAWTIAINEISASEQIPVTILIGQQTGRLASDEDQTHFAQMIMSRRQNFASSMILDVIDRMTDIGALPEHDELFIEWDDLTDTTMSEKLESAKAMEEINTADPLSEPVFSREEIREAAGFKPDDETETEELGPPEGELRDDDE